MIHKDFSHVPSQDLSRAILERLGAHDERHFAQWAELLLLPTADATLTPAQVR